MAVLQVLPDSVSPHLYLAVPRGREPGFYIRARVELKMTAGLTGHKYLFTIYQNFSEFPKN